MSFRDWLKARWNEPSTHAAIAAFIPVVRQFIPPPYQFVADILVTLFAGNGVLKAEQQSGPPR